MSTNFDRFAELEKLLNDLADDQLDVAGRTRIGELLDGDPEACEFYLDFMALNAHLEQELGSVEPVHFLENSPKAQIEEATTVYLATRQPSPPPAWRQPWVLAAAAAVAIGLFAISLITGAGKDQLAQDDAMAVTDNAVAVLTATIDARFSGNGAQLAPGDLLPKGKLALEEGVARLQFYSGAEVILEGPVEFELLGENLAACSSGSFRASVPRPAQGFTVHTPLVEMVDLGTEFGGNVTATKTEVHVFEGEVEIYDAGSKRSAESRHLLTAGYGLEIATDGSKTDRLADSLAFITEDEVDLQMRTRAAERFEAWQKFVTDKSERDPRLLAHYTFESDDLDSQVLRDRAEIGGLRNGTIIGSQWVSGRWPGKRALNFSRPSDRVRIDMKKGSKSLTLAAWVKLESLDQRYSALLATDQLKRGIEWQITRSGILHFGVRRNKRITDQYLSPVILRDRIGKWVQLAVTVDHEDRKVTHFVNGEPISTHPLKSKAAPVIGQAQLGNWNSPREGDSYPVRNLHGRIDEVMIYRVALSPAEIKELYTIGQP